MTQAPHRRLASPLSLIVLSLSLVATGCLGADVDPPGETVLEGGPPPLISWSGAADCCGEDPHPVHGALHDDGSVVMVGKAAGGGAQTAGFLTRWVPPEGPAAGRYVDGDDTVIAATFMLAGDSALLQVASVAGVLVAVGFEAASASEPAVGVALVLEPVALEVLGRLELRAADAAASAALESLALAADGRLLLGGTTGLSRDEMEGFKSYGNATGGRGVVVAVALEDLLAGAEGSVPVAPSEVGAEVLEVPEVFSVKSMSPAPDGAVFAVGSDLDEASGLLRLAPDLSAYVWTPYDEPVELTDVAVFQRGYADYAVALVGHGGEDRIDGQARLVRPDGQVLWSASFGNPGVDTADLPVEGLAPDAFVFDECWGVAVQGDELMVACGTGIEGCGAISATPAESQLCQTDPRRVWRSYVVGLSGTGEVRWARTETFVDEQGEAAESAAEFVVSAGPTEAYAIIDQNFGVGLLRLGG